MPTKKITIHFRALDWLLLIVFFLLISYRILFSGTQIQLYSFDELEDFGRYVFLLTVSAVEALFYVLIIYGIVQPIQNLICKTKKKPVKQ